MESDIGSPRSGKDQSLDLGGKVHSLPLPVAGSDERGMVFGLAQGHSHGGSGSADGLRTSFRTIFPLPQ